MAFLNYYSTLCPTVGPGDSGELTLAALRLGVCHPPGYSLFTWLGRLATLAPAPEPAFAANLLTATIAAVAVAILFLSARRLGLSTTGSVIAALSFGFGSTFWSVATVHEVYALTILVLGLLIALAAHMEQPRQLLLAAYLLGLACAHQPTALTWLPALAVLAWPARRSLGPRTLAAALGTFALGLSTTLGVLIAARANPAAAWGTPGTLAGFWRHITAGQYRELAFAVPAAELWARLRSLPGAWSAGTSVALIVAAALGIVALALRGRRLLAALLLLAGTAVFALGYRIPDYTIYLLPSFVALALLAGTAATRLEQLAGRIARPHSRLNQLAPALAVLLLLALPGHQLLLGRDRNAESRTTAVRDLGLNLLISLPDSGVLFYNGDLVGNACRYIQHHRRARPDVTLVATDMLLDRDYWSRLVPPQPLPDFDGILITARSDARPAKLNAMLDAAARAFAAARPVFLSTEMLSDDLFRGPLLQRYQPVPEGIVNRLVRREDALDRATAIAAARRNWSAYSLGSVQRRFTSPDYRHVQLIYAGSRANFGMLCFAQGWRDAAIENLEAALAMPAVDEFHAVVRANLARVRAGAN